MKQSLTTLKYVVAVDTYRSFVKAAEACGVTQPTLSVAIRNMEQELDAVIFDRSAHPVTPTALGKKIIAQARVTLGNAAYIEELVDAERGKDTGKVAMATIPTVAPYVLPGLISEMMRAHPGISMTVSEMRTGPLVDSLLRAETDIGILSTPIGQEGLLEIPLYYEKFVAYVSPGDKLYHLAAITVEELMSDRFWILEEGHCLRNQVLNFCRNRQRVHTEYQAGSIDTLIRFVDTIGGYTVIPEMHLRHLTEEQRANIRPLGAQGHGGDGPESVPTREISLVVREDFVRERLLNIIAGCIKDIVPENMLDKRLKRFAIRL